MTDQLQAILTWLLRLEDRHLTGTIRNLDDGAGLTRFGITSRFDNLFLPPDYWHMSTTDAIQTAIQFYRVRFWDKLRLGELTDPILAAALLSAAVNDGPVTAVRLFQQAIGTVVDGGLGNRTLAAANLKPDALSLFTEAQVSRYYSIASHDLTKEKFLIGWLRRARCVFPNLPA